MVEDHVMPSGLATRSVGIAECNVTVRLSDPGASQRCLCAVATKEPTPRPSLFRGFPGVVACEERAVATSGKLRFKGGRTFGGRWVGRCGVPRDTTLRCEYHDSNYDGNMDVVEPFENFMRRWDPCFHAPEASPPNRFEPQAHWIKVYDPFSQFAGTTLTCFSPAHSVDYGDDSYIRDNYPALGKLCSTSRSRCQADEDCPEGEVCRSGVEELVEESYGRLLIGSHDPYEKLPLTECKCANGLYCDDQIPDLPEGYVLPERACMIGLHVQYDPPDAWINVIAENGPLGDPVYTTKMQAVPGRVDGQAWFVWDKRTPRPSWYQQAWGDRYTQDNPNHNPSQEPGPDNPKTLPLPAPPWPTNDRILSIRTFADVNAETYEPTENRRFFWWGGWVGH